MDELLPDASWRVALLLARAGYDPMLLGPVSLSIALEVVWCQMHGIRANAAIAKAMRRPRSAVRRAARALRAATFAKLSPQVSGSVSLPFRKKRQ